MSKKYHYYLMLKVEKADDMDELPLPYKHLAYYLSDELVRIPHGPDSNSQRYDQEKRVFNEMRKAIVGELIATLSLSDSLDQYRATIYSEVHAGPRDEDGSMFHTCGYAEIDLSDPTRIIPGEIPTSESTRTTPSVSMHELRDKAPSYHFSGLGTVKDLAEFTTKTVKDDLDLFTNHWDDITIEEYGEGKSIRAKACIGVVVCFVACVATVIPAALIQADLIISTVPAIALFGVAGGAFVAGIVCLGLIINDKCREQRVKESMFAPRASTAVKEIQMSELDDDDEYRKIP